MIKNTHENRLKLATHVADNMTYEQMKQFIIDGLYNLYECDDDPFLDNWDEHFGDK